MFIPILISPYFFLPDKFAKAIIFRIIVEIILIPYLLLVLYKKEYRPRPNALTIAVASFWFVGLLATIFSIQPFMSAWGSSVRGGGFFNFTHYIIFFFILAGVVRSQKQWKRIFNFAIAAAALVSILAILQRMFPALNADFMNSSYLRPASTMGNVIMLSNFLAMLIFIVFALWRIETARMTKTFYMASGILIISTILIAQTRGTMLGILAGGLFILYFYPIKIGGVRFAAYIKPIILLSIITILLLLFIFNNTLHILPQRFFAMDNTNRLTSWQIAIKAIKDKPVLGWGPENFAVPFDKYYPGGYTNSYQNLAETWWDRAHNVPLDIGVTMGLLGLMTYLGIFALLFTKLYSCKRSDLPHFIQLSLAAAFIAYFVQNLTAFDSISSFILFFALTAYVVFLSNEKQYDTEINSLRHNSTVKIMSWAIASIIVLFIIIKFSIIPFSLNYISNRAAIIARKGLYNETIKFYRDITNKYKNKTYYEKELNEKFMKIAGFFAPSLLEQLKDREEYLKINQETINLLKRDIELEPYHTKHYYNIGLFYNNISALNPDAAKDGIIYFKKALELSPNREQTLIESAKTYMLLNNYEGAIENLQKAIRINSDLPDSYLWLGIAHLYNKKPALGKKYLKFAQQAGYDIDNITTLKMLAGVYADIQLWEETISYYLKIIEKEPNNIEIRALLAGSYKKIGQTKKARSEAEYILKIAPQAQKSIEEFLNSLPN